MLSKTDYEVYERGSFGRIILRNCDDQWVLTQKTWLKVMKAISKFMIIEKKRNSFNVRLYSDWNLKNKISEIKDIEVNKINNKVCEMLEV